MVSEPCCVLSIFKRYEMPLSFSAIFGKSADYSLSKTISLCSSKKSLTMCCHTMFAGRGVGEIESQWHME